MCICMSTAATMCMSTCRWRISYFNPYCSMAMHALWLSLSFFEECQFVDNKTLTEVRGSGGHLSGYLLMSWSTCPGNETLVHWPANLFSLATPLSPLTITRKGFPVCVKSCVNTSTYKIVLCSLLSFMPARANDTCATRDFRLQRRWKLISWWTDICRLPWG